jgi:hypothetical protein
MAENLNLRTCSMCGKVYGPEYTDTFCLCGFELVGNPPPSAPHKEAEMSATLQDKPMPGSRCLVLYGSDKQPLRYFLLSKDVTMIGRQDAVDASFPEIDVAEWLDEASARRVSRQHALVLHSRINDSYSLRPLAGNTGTQLETDMLAAQQDYPLKPGQRFILGGVVRFKFEIT